MKTREQLLQELEDSKEQRKKAYQTLNRERGIIHNIQTEEIPKLDQHIKDIEMELNASETESPKSGDWVWFVDSYDNLGHARVSRIEYSAGRRLLHLNEGRHSVWFIGSDRAFLTKAELGAYLKEKARQEFVASMEQIDKRLTQLEQYVNNSQQ